MVLIGMLLWTAVEVLAVIVVKFLPWSRVRDWFVSRDGGAHVDEDHLRVTLHEKLKTGKHRVVYGVFNRETATFVDGESVVADNIDEELREIHHDQPVVVYT